MGIHFQIWYMSTYVRMDASLKLESIYFICIYMYMLGLGLGSTLEN